MRIFDNNGFGWAIVAVALFFITAQIIRAVVKFWFA